MPTAEMAESSSAGADDAKRRASSDADSSGAPIAKDAIDPDLIKLRRTRPKIGIITAVGLVGLCAYFIFKLSPDRSFSSEPEKAPMVAVGDITSDRVATNRHVRVNAEPLVAHALRSSLNKGDIGMRVAPVRGTSDKLWIAVDGDGWVAPSLDGYSGRLRRMKDLPFGAALMDYSGEHPRLVFATVAEVRAGLAGNKVKTVTGDVLDVRDTDRIAIDQVDPNVTAIVATINERLSSVAMWREELKKAAIVPTRTGEPDLVQKTIRFEVQLPLAEVTAKLHASEIYAARVETVPRHYEGTIAEARGSGPEALNLRLTTAGGAPQALAVRDADLDLVGVFVSRPIPDDALVLITGENPADYWYVTPITLALVAIGLIFAWALVRAVRRDLLPTRA